MAGPSRFWPGFRKNREAAAADADSAAGEPSLESMAQELRNAFFGFLAFAQLVRGDPRIPDEVHRTAALMLEEAERARALSERLLERAQTAEARNKEVAAEAV